MKLKQLLEGIHDKWIFKAVFLCGTPGSGKSSIRKKLLHSFKHIDPDKVQELIMRREKIPLDHSKRTPEQEKRRGEIDKLAYKKVLGTQQERAIAGRLPIVIDRTGADYEGLIQDKKRLENLGYETKMIFVDVPVEQAIKQNLQRKRKLSSEFVKDYHKKVRVNIPRYKTIFGGNFYEIDNTRPFNEVKTEWNRIWIKIAKWMERKVNNVVAKKWKEEQRKIR